MYDPDFSAIERGYDQPPDEPHPRYVSCPECGSEDVDELPPTAEAFYCNTCGHEF